MQKHLLITVGDDASASYGVRFFSFFFKNTQRVRCTLLYVAANPEAALSLIELHREMPLVQQRIEEARQRGQEALYKAMDQLLAAGFPAKNIETKFVFREQGTASDIVNEGLKGLYDAIVLGRRGSTWLEELVADSVSKQVADAVMEIPIWVCRVPEPGRADVLLCADGSDESLRAADHVGYILSEETAHRVRVFHIWDPSQEDYLEAVDIVEQTKANLVENGVQSDRILETIKRGRGAARLIQAEADAGRYAAVCVGCTGAHRQPFKQLFLGSVSAALLHSLDKAALWISH
jgi:nucleotide-binding universal stress UspA family protein